MSKGKGSKDASQKQGKSVTKTKTAEEHNEARRLTKKRPAGGSVKVVDITSPARILKIQKTLLRSAEKFLADNELDVPSLATDFLQYLCGLKKFELEVKPSDHLSEAEDEAISLAFRHAYLANTDAPRIAKGNLPGRDLVDLTPPKPEPPAKPQKRQQPTRGQQKGNRRPQSSGQRPAQRPRQAQPTQRPTSAETVAGRLIYDKMGAHLVTKIGRLKWPDTLTEDDKETIQRAILDYARAIAKGQGSMPQAVIVLNSVTHGQKLQHIVEQTFATTCYFYRGEISGVKLPGMNTDWYREWYEGAKKLPKKKPQAKTLVNA